MSPAPNPTWSSNGDGHNNLFLEADPEVVAPRARNSARRAARTPRRARADAGWSYRSSESSPSDATATALPDATAFARRTTRAGGAEELDARTCQARRCERAPATGAAWRRGRTRRCSR